MKKVLILSYFFPPCNVTASHRPYSWYAFLHKMGYYPVVITRKWEHDINTYADVNQISSPGIDIQKEDWGEVHYLPYAGNFRDKIISNVGLYKFVFFRRFLTFWEMVLSNFFLSSIPYANMYRHAKSLAEKDSFVGTIISAGPFPQFLFGYLLHKHLNMPWIADYRDDWSTDEVERFKGNFSSLLRFLASRSEKKWVKSASAFVSISPHYVQKIEKFLGLKGFVVQNGFAEMDLATTNDKTDFVLAYNGTLYDRQPVEKFLSSLKEYNETHEQKLHVDFIGLGIDEFQKTRVSDFAKQNGTLPYLNIMKRIPKQEVMEKQKKAFALLMFGHTGLKGIPSSKIYEFLSLGKPIILFEPDGDILEYIVANYNLGYIVNKPHSFEAIVEKITSTTHMADEKYVSGFSRESQTRDLAQIFDRYF